MKCEDLVQKTEFTADGSGLLVHLHCINKKLRGESEYMRPIEKGECLKCQMHSALKNRRKA